MLTSAHQGYIYQDILGAYFIAAELASGRILTKFLFDKKKTPKGIPDRFDDLAIFRESETAFIQVKYSNDESQHSLTKQDFSSSSGYDLALFDLFDTWKSLHTVNCVWRVCLAWDQPNANDRILTVLTKLPDKESFLPGTACYQFNLDKLWPKDSGVLSSWKTLKIWSQSADRSEFGEFLDSLILEVGCPKSSLLTDYSKGLEKLLSKMIEQIGIGIYPNDHLTVRQVAEGFCTIAMSRRATSDITPITCNEIARLVNIELSNGGIEQNFPVDETLLVNTQDRVTQVIDALEQHRRVILTAEPGAGKSWFIENLKSSIENTTRVLKHYCYTALEDPLAVQRITVNVLYGSLITQILNNDDGIGRHKTKRYASNLEELNILLSKTQHKTLLIVDGIDHIWRIYQKNRGGLTENETTILEALSKLDISNPNIFILIVSQPIKQLTEHLPFFQCSLSHLSEQFVFELLKKHHIQNSVIEDVSLTELIHTKSNGNALYCKYLIDHAILNKTTTSFEWINELPSYDFNLTGYYQYLFEQIQGDSRVPYALCGADFSLTEDDLKEITHLGNMVGIQLGRLLPVLRYVPAIGSSIYHESFKRFIIDSISANGASIEHLVYTPLITWLKTHRFFESTKAYGHLLKLYYEIEAYSDIANTISIEFLEDSLFYAQPLHRIIHNHKLQRASLNFVEGFAPMLIVSEQAKIVFELKHTDPTVRINYLKAVQALHGDQKMYRVLWDGENLLVNFSDAFEFLTSQAYMGKRVVHWSIIPKMESIPYELLGSTMIQLIHTEKYNEFDDLCKRVHESSDHKKEFSRIIEEMEWWSIFNGETWKTKTPYFQSVLNSTSEITTSLENAVAQIIENDRYHFDKDWRTKIRDIVALTRNASTEEIDKVVGQLSGYNWFRNWLIYLIKITQLSNREYNNEELLSVFTCLVRDLDPFKGKPRVADLYSQITFIQKSFHQGLLLCKGNEILLVKCCDLLERVTEVSTSMQGSISGPLTSEKYLELIGKYLPKELVISKYEEYYKALGMKRVYSYVAETAFQYATNLASAERTDEALKKYKEGIQALVAYGYRKDRSLSEVLDCSVPYQKAYGTLTPDWFYELYKMAMTVVTHTDGKSTNRYPIEWFREFIQVYPDEALRFLTSETIENSEAIWHLEEEFVDILEDYPTLFTPSQWFLLCRSLPLACAEKILAYGLSIIDLVDKSLQDCFRRWLQTIPTKTKNGVQYNLSVVQQFERNFGTTLDAKKDKEDAETTNVESKSQLLRTEATVTELIAHYELSPLNKDDVLFLRNYFDALDSINDKKLILRQIARSLKYGQSADEWLIEIFPKGGEEWIYFNIYLFIYLTDGWYHGLNYTKFIKDTYEVNSKITLEILQEELGYSLSDSKYDYSSLISGNLIIALSEIKAPETLVKELIDLTFQIIKRRLPNAPNSDVNVSIYHGLGDLDRDEMVVAMLIARLKTLTTEKTQGILWSITFIAQTAPKTLIKPYYWAFSHCQHLLPIHRPLLLQILNQYVNQEDIPEIFRHLLIKSYPTGLFLEDHFIRSFVDFKIDLGRNSKIFLSHQGSVYDGIFLPLINIKYHWMQEIFGAIVGSYNEFDYRRGIIIEEHRKYYSRTDGVLTPIVSLANVAYEITNSQWYDNLKNMVEFSHPSNFLKIDFYLPEIIVQVGALTSRLGSLPTPGNIPNFTMCALKEPLAHKEWIVLAAREKEWFGEDYKTKLSHSASRILTFESKPTPDSFVCAKYLFSTHIYDSAILHDAPFDQPICELEIQDQLERSNILFVSPWVISKLGLRLDENIHAGFNAFNDNEDLVIKLITWKEDYFGNIDDGTEVPRLEGTAVLILADWYPRLLALYREQEGCFVLSRSTNELEV